MSCLLFALLLATAGTAWVQEVPAPAVDHHQHLFSPATRALSPRVKPVNADDLIGFLDEAGIRRAAVLSIAYQYGNPNRSAVEDEYAKVKAENTLGRASKSPVTRIASAACVESTR